MCFFLLQITLLDLQYSWKNVILTDTGKKNTQWFRTGVSPELLPLLWSDWSQVYFTQTGKNQLGHSTQSLQFAGSHVTGSPQNSHSDYHMDRGLPAAGNLFHWNSLLACIPDYRQRQEEKRGEKLKATKIKIPVVPLDESQVQNKPSRKGTTSALTGAPQVSRLNPPDIPQFRGVHLRDFYVCFFLPFNICSGDQTANCISWKHPTNKPSLYQYGNTHLVQKDLPQTDSWVIRV